MAMNLRLNQEETERLRSQAEREHRSMHEVVRLAVLSRIEEAERREVLPHVARNWGRTDLEVMVRYSPLIEVTLDQ